MTKMTTQLSFHKLQFPDNQSDETKKQHHPNQKTGQNLLIRMKISLVFYQKRAYISLDFFKKSLYFHRFHQKQTLFLLLFSCHDVGNGDDIANTYCAVTIHVAANATHILPVNQIRGFVAIFHTHLCGIDRDFVGA